MRRTITLAVGLLPVLLAPASVGAGQPDKVDRSLMQPALNPYLADIEAANIRLVCAAFAEVGA